MSPPVRGRELAMQANSLAYLPLASQVHTQLSRATYPWPQLLAKALPVRLRLSLHQTPGQLEH